MGPYGSEKDKSSLSKDHVRSSREIMEAIENIYTRSYTNITRFLFNGKIFVFMSLSLLLIILTPEDVKAQQSNISKDPSQLIKEFTEGKDVLQNHLETDYGQLLNIIKTQLNFDNVDSHLSLASQYFAQGKPSQGQSELQKANHEWQNTSMAIVNTGDEISSFATNNSLSITNNSRVILDHLGKIFMDMGAKAEDLRIKLAS